MPRYRIICTVPVVYTYEVDADDQKGAERQVDRDEAEALDISTHWDESTMELVAVDGEEL